MELKRVKKLNNSQKKAINNLYDCCCSYRHTTIGAIDLEDSSSYILLYDNERLCAYSELSPSDNYLAVRSFVEPSCRKKGYFDAMISYIYKLKGNNKPVCYYTDEADPAAVYMMNTYCFDIVSREYMLSKDIHRHTKTNITLKPSETDAEFIQAYISIFYPDYDYELVAPFIRDLAGANTAYYMMHDDKIIGLFLISFFCEKAYVSSFGIKAEYRRGGLGLAGIRSTYNLALDNGCKTVEVQVSDDNQPALRLYKKAGFHEAGRLSLICFDV